MLPEGSRAHTHEQVSSFYGGYSYFAERPYSLRQFVDLLKKRKRLILSLFFSILGAVTLLSFLLPPIYRSNAKIYVEREIDTEKAMLFGLNSPLTYEKLDWLNSESEILQSYPVLERVMRALDLNKVEGSSQSLTELQKAANFERALKTFQKTLKVEVIRNSNIIDIAYDAKDPRLAAAVVNKLVETYSQYRAEVFTDTEPHDFFEQQIKIADEQLRVLEERQTEFKRDSEVISPQAQTGILLSKVSDYQRSLTETQTQRLGKAAKLKIIREQLKAGQAINIPTTESSNSLSREKYIAKLKGDLFDMEVRRDRLLQKFTPDYEEVVNLNSEIAVTKKSIHNEVQQIIEEEESSLRVLEAQERSLQAAIATINQDIKNFAEKEYQLSQLSRGIDDNKQIYSMLLKQREEARISLAKAQRGIKIRIVSPGIVPVKPIKPRKALNIALGIVLGLSVGLGMAFVVEYIQKSLRSPEGVDEGYLGLAEGVPIRELPQGDGSESPKET